MNITVDEALSVLCEGNTSSIIEGKLGYYGFTIENFKKVFGGCVCAGWLWRHRCTCTD